MSGGSITDNIKTFIDEHPEYRIDGYESSIDGITFFVERVVPGVIPSMLFGKPVFVYEAL
jgi:hypothetical protein